MQYTVTRGEKGKIEVKVDVAKAGFEEAYDKILKKLQVDAKIAGFRPGKAPAAVVEQHIGLSRLLNETASLLVSKHLSDILTKENLVPLDSPKIAIGSLAKALPFSFTASFVKKPEVKLGDWKKLKVKKVKVKQVTEADVEESIKNIYEAWVKNKSKVEIEGEQETRDQKPGTKFIYDAHGNKIFLKDDKETKPKSKVESEIDDNFAKAIGANDLAHLREIVKKDLETLVADAAETKFEGEIFDKLVEICTVEVSDILVEDELTRILLRLSSELEKQGKTLETYLTEQKTTVDELKNKWRDQAEKNVRISLVLEKIGKEEKVQVAKEEVEQALKGVNQTSLSDDQRKDLERYLAVSIFQAKTLDLVKKAVSS